MGSNLVFEAGVVGSDTTSDGRYNDFSNDFERGANGGAVYGKVVYHFGAPKRLDCSRLYEIEIQMLRRQLEGLQESYVISERVNP